jgi:Ca2+-binding EF-hand superfamily protein
VGAQSDLGHTFRVNHFDTVDPWFMLGIDNNDDGVITVAELLSAYDTDHSGALDMKEMESLAQKLTAQVRLGGQTSQR